MSADDEDEPNTKNINDDDYSGSVNDDDVYEDEHVLRYDSYAYCKKYGDKWKKFANSIRDIPQEDGSIIREYVIEDPSLLEQLSEEDDEHVVSEIIDDIPNLDFNLNTKPKTPSPIPMTMNQTQIEKSTIMQRAANLQLKESQQEVSTRPPLPDSVLQNRRVSASIASKQALIQQHATGALTAAVAAAAAANTNGPQVTQQKEYQKSSSYVKPVPVVEFQWTNNSNNNVQIKSESEIKVNNVNEDENDEEIEKIQNEGQLLVQQQQQQLEPSSESSETTMYEYEIMDENGNVLKLDGGEELKKLAASVKYVKQPDGSVVREYILSDPNVIQQIKTQMSHTQQAKSIKYENKDTNGTRIPIQTHFDTSQMPFLTAELNRTFKQQPQQSNLQFTTPVLNQVPKAPLLSQQLQIQRPLIQHIQPTEQVKQPSIQQQQQQQQQKKNDPLLEPGLRQIDQNKYEILTKSGRLVQFQITYGAPSIEDVKEIQHAIEQNIVAKQPKQSIQIEPHYENVDDMSWTFNQKNHFNTKQPENSLNRLKMHKSCDNLTQIHTEPMNQNYPSVTKIVYNTNGNNTSEKSKSTIESQVDFKRSQPQQQVIDTNTRPIVQQQPEISVTPEMTEQLILKLLLQQLLQSQQQQPNSTQLSQILQTAHAQQQQPQQQPNIQKYTNQPLVNPHIYNNIRPSLRRSSAFSNYISNKGNLKNDFK